MITTLMTCLLANTAIVHAKDPDFTYVLSSERDISVDLLTSGGSDPLSSEADKKTKREEIADFALQFVGNPYVWGGTSLTDGADCSGFVLAVLNEFGYSIPRVAADQFSASTKKDLTDLEPGDLVFYGSDIHHVAIYIGENKIVHAANSDLGIIVSDVTWESPAYGGTFLE